MIYRHIRAQLESRTGQVIVESHQTADNLLISSVEALKHEQQHQQQQQLFQNEI